MRDFNGAVVFSDDQAETLATYFERIQWRVRPVQAVDDDRDADLIGVPLHVDEQRISMVELQRAAKKIKGNKACGVDDVPGEFWKIIVEDSSHAISEWVLEFCCNLWGDASVPEDWHLTRVTAIFKKGDFGECVNYRLISLICVGYKLYVNICLSRLKDVGAENKIWNM